MRIHEKKWSRKRNIYQQQGLEKIAIDYIMGMKVENNEKIIFVLS